MRVKIIIHPKQNNNKNYPVSSVDPPFLSPIFFNLFQRTYSPRTNQPVCNGREGGPWALTGDRAISCILVRLGGMAPTGGLELSKSMKKDKQMVVWVVATQTFLEFSPRSLGKWSNLTSIFFKWVGSTTNQLWTGDFGWGWNPTQLRIIIINNYKDPVIKQPRFNGK